VLGKPLQLLHEDNRSTAGESVTIVKKFISRDKVVAVLGEVASGRSLEAAPVCQAAGIPMISPSSTNPKVTAVGDCIFRVCFTDPFQGRLIAEFARKSLKLSRVAVFSDVSSAYGDGLRQYFTDAFTAAGGQVVVQQKYSSKDKDFKAQLTAIKAANPEGICVPGYYNEVGLIVKQARELGITVPMFGGDGWEAPELIQIAGGDGSPRSSPRSCPGPVPSRTMLQGAMVCRNLNFPSSTVRITAAFGGLRWASMRVRPLAETRSVVARAALILAGSGEPARVMASARILAES
jgi:ABC-type branched-subunit amino acid transport system substrate-binding protein